MGTMNEPQDLDLKTEKNHLQLIEIFRKKNISTFFRNN